METTQFESRAYTPQISKDHSDMVRRIAWFLDKPMTKTLEHIILIVSALIEPSKICLSCQDNSDCKTCVFCSLLSEKDKEVILKAFNIRRVGE